MSTMRSTAVEADRDELVAEIRARSITLHTDDGLRLGAQLFVPHGEPRATVVVHGATATPQRYYRAFARALAARGLRVLTYDYRGIGESRPDSLRGFNATMTEWATKDAKAALEAALRYPEPVVFVGHSFGGQLVGLLDVPERVRAMVTVGAQLGWVGHWPLARRLAYASMWSALVPASVLAFGYQPGFLGLGVDLPSGVALEWARWCSSPSYLLDHHRDAEARFAAIDVPVLAYSFTDDGFAPRRSVEAYLSKLRGARVVHRRFAPSTLGKDEVDHFGFFRRGVVPSLWEETIGFIEDAADGIRSSITPATPWQLEIEEIEADLAYGRA
jgi:predicted alpha/beta hydrolase